MRRNIRKYAPFIMLGYSMVFAVCSYFKFYYSFFNYTGDLLGYSIFTNIFMLSVYFNKKYCHLTKIAVLGLIALNVSSIICKYFGLDYALYDIYMLIIIYIILLIKRK